MDASIRAWNEPSIAFCGACELRGGWGSFPTHLTRLARIVNRGSADPHYGRDLPSDCCAERTHMPVLRVNDREHELKPGSSRLGGGAGVDVPVSHDERLGVQATVEVTESHSVIRRAGNAVVKVNGVLLGAEPTPLMHGDKVEIAGQELLFAEDAKVGATRHVSREDVAGVVPKRQGARPTTGTGGRLVSLVDGKEYVVRPTGVTIGRDASCDVVVAQNEVSRRHAEIVPSDRGYLVHDYSTNGVYVNGSRVQQSQLLARSDVVRIGTEEFRFYADVIPATPAVSSAAAGTAASVPASASAAPSSVSAPSPQAAPVMSSVATDRVPAVPEAPSDGALAASARPVLATLEVTDGAQKGQRFEIRVPLAHVGRGAYNDVVIEDDSVSDTHAKLQRRDDGWYLIDLGSMNGTFAGGSRIAHERRLDGFPALRFGAVSMSFAATDLPTIVGKGTRAMASMNVDRGKTQQREPRTAPARPVPPSPPPSSGLSIWVWVLILVAAAAFAFYLLKT
jgi:pSer/pThr/pTyr-binding forkhead associated (FHA) protein